MTTKGGQEQFSGERAIHGYSTSASVRFSVGAAAQENLTFGQDWELKSMNSLQFYFDHAN